MLPLLKKLEMDNIQFVRFEACDCIGTGIGKLVPIKAAKEFIKNNCIGLAEIFWMMTTNNNGDLEDWRPTNFRNANCKIYPNTYTIIPWSPYKIASILIYPTINNNILEIDTRTIALKQLNKLKTKYNIDLLSSFEHEFYLLNPSTSQPFKFEQNGFFHPSALSQFDNFFLKLSDNFDKMNIEIETMHPEYGKGLYEITTKPKWNISAGDAAYRVKTGIRELALINDLQATFVSVPFDIDTDDNDNDNDIDINQKKENVAGSHFNISLWGNNKKTNLLFDKNKINNGLDGLSEIGKYWIAGILHHIPGLTLFCAPTTNCFQRFKMMKKMGDEPYGTWGRNDRVKKIRLKMNGDRTYLEFRLPSSLSNPYMVIASVVIAGMDGIENKMEIPMETNSVEWDGYSQQFKDDNFKKMPMDINSALDATINDQVLCNGFGEEFMIHFVKMKRVEIDDDEKLKIDKKRPALFSKL